MDVNRAMSSELFPVDFPEELATAAIVSGNEVAWRPVFATTAVEWLAAHEFAVLGSELWLLKERGIRSLPIGLSGMREVHGNRVDGRRDESWASFVSRAAGETLKYLRSFDAAEIVEKGDVYFNVTWVTKAEFEKLRK
jgi:hypothetical protein